jgi:hypothetical protein
MDPQRRLRMSQALCGDTSILLGLRGVNRQADHERRANALLRLEGQAAAVLVHNHRASNGQTLSRAFAHFLCGEEGVEDLAANFRRDAPSRIPHPHYDLITFLACGHGDEALAIGAGHDVADGMRRVHDNVEEGLVELTNVANDR